MTLTRAPGLASSGVCTTLASLLHDVFGGVGGSWSRSTDRVVKERRCRRLVDVNRFARKRLAFIEPPGTNTGDRLGTKFLQILHCSSANATERPSYQDTIPRLDAERVDGLPRRKTHQRQCGPRLETYIRGKLRKAGQRGDRKFRMAAPTIQRQVGDDPITD